MITFGDAVVLYDAVAVYHRNEFCPMGHDGRRGLCFFFNLASAEPTGSHSTDRSNLVDDSAMIAKRPNRLRAPISPAEVTDNRNIKKLKVRNRSISISSSLPSHNNSNYNIYLISPSPAR